MNGIAALLCPRRVQRAATSQNPRESDFPRIREEFLANVTHSDFGLWRLIGLVLQIIIFLLDLFTRSRLIDRFIRLNFLFPGVNED